MSDIHVLPDLLTAAHIAALYENDAITTGDDDAPIIDKTILASVLNAGNLVKFGCRACDYTCETLAAAQVYHHCPNRRKQLRQLHRI